MYQTFSEKLSKHKDLLVYAYFIFFFITGLSTYKDYGIGWDDPFGRQNGIINAIYIAERFAPSILEGKNYCADCPKLINYSDVDHGPFFELIPTFLEWAFNIKDLQQAFWLRHICGFLCFFIGTVFFFKLLKIRFKNIAICLAGTTMLILSPRIFAEAFFNAKDLPFLALTAICCYTLINFINNQNFKTAIWHGIACALALDIRILALIFPLATIAILVWDNISNRKQFGTPILKTLKYLATYIVIFIIFTIVFWPYLWKHPFDRFFAILLRSGSYPWDGAVFYQGEFVHVTQLPWHYLSNWVAITTPPVYLLLFLAGVGTVVYGLFSNFFKKKFVLYTSVAERQDLTILGFLLVIIIGTIVAKLVLYDAYRHMFFIYIFVIYLSTLGLASLSQIPNWFRQSLFQKTTNYALVIICILNFAFMLAWMVKYHPHQNVYFNVLAGKKPSVKFELDYWGLSYKQAFEYILTDTDKSPILVYPNRGSAKFNYYSLAPEQRNRIEFVEDGSKADYFLTEHRGDRLNEPGWEVPVKHIMVDNIEIMSIYKLK